jgi:hypothetical protein
MIAPRVLMLVHGKPESIEAVRATGLSKHHPADRIQTCYRAISRAETLAAWEAGRRDFKPDIIYMLNTAMPGAAIAPWWRIAHGLPYILDTGDTIYEMALRSGVGGGWQLPALWFFEELAQRAAAGIVVRGSAHREYLLKLGRQNVTVIRDGYAECQSVPSAAVSALKARLGLEGFFVAGIMGSTVYSPTLGICYGWDLLEALTRLKDLPVKALIIGDGSGLSWLRERAQTLGVADRVVFTGRIPYPEVPTYLRTMDVALSTQTNNLAGRVRTTGKLPEYMAAERFILASRVGEAAVVLPELMLLDYLGEVDPDYPVRLADRIRLLQTQPALLELRRMLPGLAKKQFSYDVLSSDWSAFISSAANRSKVDRRSYV